MLSHFESRIGLDGVMRFLKAAITAGDKLAWLIKLRWIAVVGQLLAIIFAASMVADRFALMGLLSTVGAVALSNLYLHVRNLSPSRRTLGVTILFDVAALTALLYFSGGASNPFGFFYVIHVALAAILLGERWTWLIATVASCCYGVLFFFSIEVPALSAHHNHSGDGFSLHLQGMWVAFTLTSVSLAFFFTKMISALKLQEEELALVREKALRTEKLAAVTSLAAMAAHELNTPLATIHIVAEEMIKALQASNTNLKDAELILSEVSRCRAILERLRIDTGSTEGGKQEEVAIEDAVKEAVARVSIKGSQDLTISPRACDLTLRAPRRPLIEALFALIKNALESGESVRLNIDAERSNVLQRVVISDNGKGISEADLKRVGEPFFSTKPTGSGMGIGVFLARSFVEALGGELKIRSTVGVGTDVILEFPA